MDSTEREIFIMNCSRWGRAQHSKNGWRIPYWDLEDWEQWGALWALTVLKRYGDLTPGHLFSLVRTSAFRDLVDRTRSVAATVIFDPELDLRFTPDTVPLLVLPPLARALTEAVVAATPDQWIQAEEKWGVLYPHTPFYPDKSAMLPEAPGLSLVIGWNVARIRRAQFALRCHVNH